MTDGLMIWKDATGVIRRSRARNTGTPELPFEPVVVVPEAADIEVAVQSIDTKTPALEAGRSPVVLPSLGAAPTVTALELTGTAVALPALAGRRMLRIQNTSRGDGVVWIGAAGVDYASRNGLRLSAGESLEIAATDAAAVYASGDAWRLISSLPGQGNQRVMMSVGGSDIDNTILVIDTYPLGEVWRSINGGQSWTKIQRLGTETDIFSFGQVDTNILLAGTSPTGQIWRSTDGGLTWALAERLGTETSVRSITRISGSGNSTILVAGTIPTGQIYRSTDGGQTWALQQQLGIATTVSNICYISGTGGSAHLVAGTNTGEIYRSTNGGVDWTLAQKLGSETFLQRIVLVSGTGESAILVVGTFPNGQIWRSVDGGQSWTLAQDISGVTNVVEIALVTGTGDTAVLLATDTGRIWRSVNGGQSWTLDQSVMLDQSVGPTSIRKLVVLNDKLNRNSIIMSVGRPGNQIYRSTDAGITPLTVMEY